MLLTHYNELINLINLQKDKLFDLRKKIIIKNDDSPVTEANILLQKIILNYFSIITPSIKFLSEEMPIESYKNLPSKLLIIDPIDGTENFISGLPIWGVALSYWENSKHDSSMIYLPELNKLLITGAKLNYNTSRIAGYSSSINEELLSLIEPGKESRIFGCSVSNFYNFITRSFKSFENPKGAYVWDLFAGLNLALEHGCKVTVEGKEYHGEFLDPHRRHPHDFISTHPCFYSENKDFLNTFTNKSHFEEFPSKIFNNLYSTKIGNDVLIYSNVLIVEGVNVGDGSIILPGAVVTKDVEPYSLVGGVPAKLIKYRFEKELIDKLLDFKWWNKDLQWIKDNHSAFLDPNLFKKLLG